MEQKIMSEKYPLIKANCEDQPLYFNMKKFVKVTGLPLGLIERLICQKKLKCIIVGRMRFIPREELERLPSLLF
jgi:hypothetical protein